MWISLSDAIEAAFGPDPGLLRFRAAMRALVSASLTLGALYFALGGQSKGAIAAISLGFMCSALASRLVQDGSSREQATMLALLFVPACASAALASFLGAWPWIADATLVLVVFGAVLARLAGPRGFATGMVCFISFFIGLVIRPPFDGVPLLVGGVATGLIGAALTLFLLIPVRPDVAVRRMAQHIDRRLRRLLGEVERAISSERHDSKPFINAELARLGDIVLAASDQLDLVRSALGSRSTRITSALLALELSAERVARTALSGSSTLRPQDVHALRDSLTRNSYELLDSGAVGTLVGDLAKARADLALSVREMQKAERPDADAGSQAPKVMPKTMSEFWSNPMVRQAVQATIGAALALVLGALVSQNRPYWAVIAAFIVQSGVGSRGEAFIKALQRIVGTAAGVALGMLLASVIGGQTAPAIGLILICLFVAYYAFQQAYSIMIFAITLMLALLYGLLGRFTPDLLLVRMEETAVGAAVAVAVTMLVLPTSQHDAFRSAVRDFVVALRKVLDTTAGGEAAGKEAILEMRSKTQAVRDSVASLKRGWTFLLTSRYRQAVRAVLRSDYLVREMVRAAPVPEESRHAVGEEASRILDELDGREKATGERLAERRLEEAVAGQLVTELRSLRDDLRATR